MKGQEFHPQTEESMRIILLSACAALAAASLASAQDEVVQRQIAREVTEAIGCDDNAACLDEVLARMSAHDTAELEAARSAEPDMIRRMAISAALEEKARSDG